MEVVRLFKRHGEGPTVDDLREAYDALDAQNRRLELAYRHIDVLATAREECMSEPWLLDRLTACEAERDRYAATLKRIRNRYLGHCDPGLNMLARWCNEALGDAPDA